MLISDVTIGVTCQSFTELLINTQQLLETLYNLIVI